MVRSVAVRVVADPEAAACRPSTAAVAVVVQRSLALPLAVPPVVRRRAQPGAVPPRVAVRVAVPPPVVVRLRRELRPVAWRWALGLRWRRLRKRLTV